MKRRLLLFTPALAGILLAAARPEPARLRAAEPQPDDPPGFELGNVPMPTLGGVQFWADELFFHRWRIQRNVITGHCRLLDEYNLRHASGTYEECLAKLVGVKRQRELPPMRGKAVVVLHGLGRTRGSMGELCEYLREHGDYTVFNVGYASTRRGIADHARALAAILENLHGVTEINFVGHSLGNIVVRRYLAERVPGRHPDPRIRRFVMLGPPNHGSLAATAFSENELFTAITGKPGQQLGRQWVWLEADLATPRCQFGIIAGGKGDGKGFHNLLPGDDDGVVTVASTRLAGAADFLVVPQLHSFLPGNRNVIEHTLRFLQHGYFVSPEQRRPVRLMIDD